MSTNKTKNWVNVVQEIQDSYNSSKHSAHGYAPNSIKKKDIDQILHNLYSKFTRYKPKQKYFHGNKVRISEKRLAFFKGYRPQFSEEIFTVDSVNSDFPVYSYKLSDGQGNILDSIYVNEELSLANKNGDEDA